MNLNKNQYKRYKARLKKQQVNVIFNYSKVQLTKDMEMVLNRGQHFAIHPIKLDLTHVLTDFKRFERTMIWQEFWHGRDDSNTQKKTIFKQKKSNLPKNYSSPNNLKTFLAGVKSEILDPKNRRKAKCNLPESEVKAIKELIKLQKDRKIIIKQCDKGAGLIILDFEKYMKACHDHLESETKTAKTIMFQLQIGN